MQRSELVMSRLGHVALIALLTATSLAAPARAAEPAKVRRAGATPAALSTFTFTAAGRAGLASVERTFKFTPPGAPESKAVTLTVATRRAPMQRTVVAAAIPVPAAATTAGPVVLASAAGGPAYAFDLALGWRGFGVQGAYARSDSGVLLGSRQSLDLGVTYGRDRWRTGLLAMAEQDNLFGTLPDGQRQRRYAVELGGTYAMAPGLAFNGGVRYRMAPIAPTPIEPDRGEGTLYLGTSLAF